MFDGIARRGSVGRHCEVTSGCVLRRCFGWVLCTVLACVVSCGGARGNAENPETERANPVIGAGQPVSFSYLRPDGRALPSSELLGRESLLLFLTTYDNVSLAVVRRLIEMLHRRVPRFNAVLVALEPMQNAELVAIYRESLGGELDVVLADPDTFNGGGAFGDMRAVPSVVLLDRDARIVMRGFGVEAYREAEALLMAHSVEQ
jgi:hypothetical protein